jgi:RHS repeat-associated protein
VEDASITSNYRTPYKFTGKELDKETGLYYFGARYYDARVGRWVSADPALVEDKYLPKPNDYDTEHDFFWYLQQDGSKKLPGIGGVFNAVNLDVYHYAGLNPVKLVDPDGEAIWPVIIAVLTYLLSDLTPLNNNEESTYKNNILTDNVKSTLINESVKTSIDSTIGKINRNQEINQAIKKTTQKLRDLERN